MARFAPTLLVRYALALLLGAGLSGTADTARAAQVDLPGPAGSVSFGSQVAVLPNGNIVVTDVRDPAGGAAYLYSVNRTLISKVTGIAPGAQASADFEFVKIVVLKNGNYVLVNPRWSEGSKLGLGMVAWGSKTSGISGVISPANALLGSTVDDRIGINGIVLLENGNYVVRSQFWNNGDVTWAGAATWGNGTTGTSGRVSAANSLVGTHPSDGVGGFVLPLTNGNYVAVSAAWSSDSTAGIGAITWANGATGLSGPVTAANSITGSKTSDGSFSWVHALTNGNFVVAFPYWNETRGAVYWGNGSTGASGVISPANALVGSQPGNYVGYSSITPLTNGNYVVNSSYWEGPGQADVGAITWGNGSTGRVGAVSPANSLVGDFDFATLGAAAPYRIAGVTALANGNYVVASPRWGTDGKSQLGAITWGNGSTGLTGTVTASNSLIGGTEGDMLGVAAAGASIAALANGNYVVVSSQWHDADGNEASASTWRDGSRSHPGVATEENSLRGNAMVTPLSNGHYVVALDDGVAWADGTVGRSGVLTPDNSLVGFRGVPYALQGGNYLVCEPNRTNGSLVNAGAVTWSDGTTGVIGEPNASNSLLGTSAEDQLCTFGAWSSPVVPLPDERYLLYSEDWDNGSIIDADAVTLGIGPLSGSLSPSNAVMGTAPYAGDTAGNGAPGTFFVYDAPRGRAVVGRPASNLVSFLSLDSDVGPTLSISDVALDEGDSGTRLASFTVQLSAASAAPVTFDIGTANASASADDFVGMLLRGQVIPAGATSKTFTVAVNGDLAMEPDERFTVNVSNVIGAKVIDAQAIGLIRNDDGSTLSIADVALTEGDQGTKVMRFTARLPSPLPTPVSFDVSTSDGTAIAGQDYVAKAVSGLTIPAGALTATFAVVIKGDASIESDETFTVTISNATGTTIADGVATGTLLNDDRSFLKINRVATVEGNSGSHVMTFTASLTSPVSVDVSYTIHVESATAQAGSDFQGAVLVGETIPAGATHRDFDVIVHGDTEVEQDEFFSVRASTISGPVIGGGAFASGFILNDENAVATPTLSIADLSIAEGNNGQTFATFSVLLSETAGMTVAYDIATSDGTALAGEDYSPISLQVERITPGNLGRTFVVPVFGDGTPEASETFTVMVSNVVGATPAVAQATGRILDDDSQAPLPLLSIANVSVAEGNVGGTPALFTAQLSAPAPASGVGFTVSTKDLAATSGASAVADNDYSALAPTQVLIAPGETSATFAVKVLGDTRKEADEVFAIEAHGIFGAVMPLRSAQVTILNDDASVLHGTTPTKPRVEEATPDTPRIAIAAVQGKGPVSPVRGDTATVQGVVTALRRNGFFLQAPDNETDADPATSEGLFVFTGGVPSSVARLGNRLEVAGQVQELPVADGAAASMTTLVSERVALVATGRPLPQPAILDAGKIHPGRNQGWTERYEGMRIAVPKLMVVAPVSGQFNPVTAEAIIDGNFHGVAWGVPRPIRQADAIPGKLYAEEPAGAVERLRVESLGQTGARVLSVDVGDAITGLVGVLVQGAENYTVFPDPSARIHVVAGAMPRAVTPPLASDITIGGFDARRLVDTTDAPGVDEPVASPDAYALRLAKAANAICAYQRSPDILALTGVENRSVFTDLAAAINSAAGNELFPAACTTDPGYRAVMVPGKDGVGQLGFLVRVSPLRSGSPRVTVVTTRAEGASERFTHADGSTEPLFDQTLQLLRAQVNEVDGGQQVVSVLAVQLQAAPAPADTTAGMHGWPSRTAYVLAKRQAQVRYLGAWATRRQLADPSEKLVMVGGFESVAFRDRRGDLMDLATDPAAFGDNRLEKRLPGDAGATAPLANLTWLLPETERYSVIREGNAEAVDHVLANAAMLRGGFRLRIEVARINADFGEDNAGDFGVPMRVSEHDPQVLYLSKP